jgi:hypothetical protein
MEEERKEDRTPAPGTASRLPLPAGQTAAATVSQLRASGPSSAATAPAADDSSINRRRFFIELDSPSLSTSTEQKLWVAQLPTDWLVDEPPAELVC